MSDEPKAGTIDVEAADKAITDVLDQAFAEGTQEQQTATEPADKPETDAQAPEAEPAAPDEGGQKDGTETDAKPDEGQDTAPTEGPGHWTPEERAAFSGLPAEAQALVVDIDKRREAAWQRKTEELGQSAKLGTEVDQILAPHRAAIQAAGWTDGQAIKHLAELHSYARQDGPGYLAWATEQVAGPNASDDQVWQVATSVLTKLGFDLNSIVGQGDETSEDIDPSFQKLKQEITDRITELGSAVNGMSTQFQARDAQQAQATIDAWSGEKDADGNPLRPHFERVRGDMSFIFDNDPHCQALANDPRARLDKAYELACLREPEIREQNLSSEIERRSKAERAARAKTAGAPVRTSAGGRTEARPPSNPDDLVAGVLNDFNVQ